MYRFMQIVALGAVALTSLTAGTMVQIGSGANGVNGLTAYNTGTGVGYMNSTTGPGALNQSCAGSALFAAGKNPGFTGCAKAATGNGEKDYATLLFENAGGPSFVAPSGTSLTDTNGIQYARIADTGKNFWAAQQNGDVTVAIGIYGVQNVYTMLNDYWGANNEKDTSVIFNWSSSSSWGNGGVVSQTFVLTNGVEIRSAVNCATPANCKTNGFTAGFTGESGELPIATTRTASNTANVYSSPYSTIGSISGYNGYSAPGTINLDSQTFSFGGTHATDYLVSITIRNVITAAYGSTNPVGNSRTALSAITIETVPEPSTVLMFMSGLGLVGYLRRRKA